MSHTTAIKGIKIQNIAALTAAIAELNGKGVKCSLAENATPRAYFPNQPGLGLADYVVRLDDAAYDVGLYKQEDGSYEARTDFWSSPSTGKPVASILGGVATKPEYNEQSKMGRLFQAYGIHAAMHEARKQGKSVRRIDNEQTGEVKLVLTGFN